MIKTPILVATGDKWIGYGTRSFVSVLSEMLDEAENEIVMTVYILSELSVIDSIEKSLNRGVKTEIYFYKDGQDTRNIFIEKLEKMKEIYPHLSVYAVTEDLLHAKVLVADNKKCLVGSANLTFGGLIKNYELGFMVENAEISNQISKLLRRLQY